MLKVLVFYGEIFLKGKNKFEFENKLIKNIQRLAKFEKLEILKVKKFRNVLEIDFKDGLNRDEIINFLKRISGIKYFSFVEVIKRDQKELFIQVKKYLERFKEEGICEISISTKRSDKTFAMKSPEINSKIGEYANELGIKINYKNQENILYIQITSNKIYFSFKKEKGMEGLPVGSVGRVLCLLSGGIDSPVAAYHLMKRGCHVDFIHFHSFATNDIAFKSKIKETIEILNKFQGNSKLYLMPNVVYEMLTGGVMDERYEMIFFKYFILNYASKLAKEFNYGGVVTGDNLAQVASQTIENMYITSLDVESLVLRPLLSFEKEEIIAQSNNIGTFNLAIQEYKDCCSLLSKNPITKGREDKFRKYLEKVDLEKLFAQGRKHMGIYDVF